MTGEEDGNTEVGRHVKNETKKRLLRRRYVSLDRENNNVFPYTSRRHVTYNTDVVVLQNVRSNSYYAASSSTPSSSLSSSLPSAAAVGNSNCAGGGGGVKSSKRQKVNHQFAAKGGGGRNQNGGGQPAAGQVLLQQSHHAIVPDQLKLYSECTLLNPLIRTIRNLQKKTKKLLFNVKRIRRHNNRACAK